MVIWELPDQNTALRKRERSPVGVLGPVNNYDCECAHSFSALPSMRALNIIEKRIRATLPLCAQEQVGGMLLVRCSAVKFGQ